MKTSFTLVMCLLSVFCFGQKQINTSKSTSGIQKIVMDFKYPEHITVSNWDKDEIVITGKAKINNGENDEAFKLSLSSAGGIITVKSIIEDIENLPKRIVIRRDDVDYYFPTDKSHDPKIQEFLAEGNGDHQYQMHGVIKEITLDIKVPKNVALQINAKYGLVEVKNISNEMEVDAKYGGVDVSLPTSAPRNIVAKTKYGEMFSDLDMQINPKESTHSQYYSWTTISAQLSGGGPKCSLESKYGNIYIRKL